MKAFDPRLTVIASQARVKTCHVYHCWQAVREMGKGFHAGAFAHFSGLEERHVAAILAALADNDVLPQRRCNVSETVGKRLPADWKAPPDWIEWAVGERRWHPDVAATEAEQFADYWRGKAGKDGVKLDWQATWRNWVRGSRRPDGDYRPPVGMVSSREHMERTAALYEKMGRSNEAADIRRTLAESANVLPFKPGQKVA